MAMTDLLSKYWDWIDESIYDGLTDEEAEELDEENTRKNGIRFVLKKDAPPEAVAAWKEDGRLRKEATERGVVID